jgi:hypothetical protein
VNNPLKYYDPDGEIIQFLAAAATIYLIASEVKGIAKAFHNRKWNNPEWKHADPTLKGTPANNSLRITNGLFIADRTQSRLQQAWTITKRFTWQLPFTVSGYLAGQTRNVVKDVRRVDYFYGSTVIYDHNYNHDGAFSLGGYITMHYSEYIDHGTGFRNDLLLHEYGHYLQERNWGPFVGIGYYQSVTDNDLLRLKKVEDHGNLWIEQDANKRSLKYFSGKGNDNFKYTKNPNGLSYKRNKWSQAEKNYLRFVQERSPRKYYDSRYIIDNTLLLINFW